MLSNAFSFKMDAATVVAGELASDKSATLAKKEKEDDAVSVDRGFTCDTYATKKFFVDDTEEQHITKLPQVDRRTDSTYFRHR